MRVSRYLDRFVLIAAAASKVLGALQAPLTVEHHSTAIHDVRLDLSSTWEALGPFPAGTREHPLISSSAYAFLVNGTSDPDVAFARLPYDASEAGTTWPSALGRDGRVGWDAFETQEDGYVEVKYPKIRWDQHRAFQGWAALQYQSLLRTNLSVQWTTLGSDMTNRIVSLRSELLAGIEFAIFPASIEGDSQPIEWYNGDVYSFAASFPPHAGSFKGRKTSALSHTVDLNVPAKAQECAASQDGSSMHCKTHFVVLIRAEYDIRLFNDPGIGNPNGPAIRFKFAIEAVHPAEDALALLPELDVIGGFVDGWLVGEYLGIGLTSRRGDLEVLTIHAEPNVGLDFELGTARFALYQGQSRILPVRVAQSRALRFDEQEIKLNIEYRARHGVDLQQKTHSFQISHFQHLRSSPVKLTYLGPSQAVNYAMLVPPLLNSFNDSEPTILALHGAGVHADSSEWVAAIPQRKRGWAVLPTGGTEWGLDWHGPTMENARSALQAARMAVNALASFTDRQMNETTILIGHSNGGQGAWHLSARYPDEFLGVIPAAGYLKIQDYVPYTAWTSDHFADPALVGLLKSSLSPYNNDLYASNLVDLPILALHGAEDDNVPATHSRTHLGLVQSWAGDRNVTQYRETPHRGHFWSDIFRTTDVNDFLKQVSTCARSWADRFVLTTVNPNESGAKHGVRILELAIPGRLARLEVEHVAFDHLNVRAANVRRFAVPSHVKKVTVASNEISVSSGHSLARVNGIWTATPPSQPRAYGPMIRIWSSDKPVIVVVGTKNAQFVKRHQSIAQRIASDAFTHQRLNVDVLEDWTVLEMLSRGDELGNLIIVGSGANNALVHYLEQQEANPPVHHLASHAFKIGHHVYSESGIGLIYLRPHPNRNGLVCVLSGTDEAGLELAARLVPVRTGVPIPEWAVIGPLSRYQGAVGILAAGFWSHDWNISAEMSYF